MKLADWMSREGLDDVAMSDRMKAAGVTIDRTSVSRIRRGKQWPSRDIHAAIHTITLGEVGTDPLDYSEPEEKVA